MENGIFSRSGKHSTKVKWEKNSFRMAVVVGCSVVAWVGAADLDKFVSLIGSVAWCVPYFLVLCWLGALILVSSKQRAVVLLLPSVSTPLPVTGSSN